VSLIARFFYFHVVGRRREEKKPPEPLVKDHQDVRATSYPLWRGQARWKRDGNSIQSACPLLLGDINRFFFCTQWQ